MALAVKTQVGLGPIGKFAELNADTKLLQDFRRESKLWIGTLHETEA